MKMSQIPKPNGVERRDTKQVFNLLESNDQSERRKGVSYLSSLEPFDSSISALRKLLKNSKFQDVRELARFQIKQKIFGISDINILCKFFAHPELLEFLDNADRSEIFNFVQLRIFHGLPEIENLGILDKFMTLAPSLDARIRACERIFELHLKYDDTSYTYPVGHWGNSNTVFRSYIEELAFCASSPDPEVSAVNMQELMGLMMKDGTIVPHDRHISLVMKNEVANWDGLMRSENPTPRISTAITRARINIMEQAMIDIIKDDIDTAWRNYGGPDKEPSTERIKVARDKVHAFLFGLVEKDEKGELFVGKWKTPKVMGFLSNPEYNFELSLKALVTIANSFQEPKFRALALKTLKNFRSDYMLAKVAVSSKYPETRISASRLIDYSYAKDDRVLRNVVSESKDFEIVKFAINQCDDCKALEAVFEFLGYGHHTQGLFNDKEIKAVEERIAEAKELVRQRIREIYAKNNLLQDLIGILDDGKADFSLE